MKDYCLALQGALDLVQKIEKKYTITERKYLDEEQFNYCLGPNEIIEETEICDNLDDNCNGQVDEEPKRPLCTKGLLINMRKLK